MEKPDTYKESTVGAKKTQMRKLNLEIKSSPTATHRLVLLGFIQDNVIWTRRVQVTGADGKHKKETETTRVPWAQRYDKNEQGFAPIGVRINLEGDSQNLIAYDATEYLAQNLRDNMAVEVKGHIELRHYESGGEMRRSISYIPDEVALASVDFESPDFIELARFDQQIIYQDINKADTGFTVEAQVLGYKSIDQLELEIHDSSLAGMFKKNLKPFTAIRVEGYLTAETEEDEVDEDRWGAPSTFRRVRGRTIRKLVIDGAAGESIDTETYRQESLEKAIAAIRAHEIASSDFGDSVTNKRTAASQANDTSWGSFQGVADSSTDDDDPWAA